VLLAGLSSGHKIGLAVVAACFIGFALISSFVAPRRRPDFPGRAGMSVFVIACFVLFAAMLTAVEVFGAESEAKASESAAVATPLATFQVQEKEFRIVLPATARKALRPGTYRFVAHNVGTVQHDLAVSGPGAHTKTALISPGKQATLTVTLEKGVYTLYCSVPGHRAAGMVAKLTVS
jgi:uncharacterized cupredoxin-like copper-binding protein